MLGMHSENVTINVHTSQQDQLVYRIALRGQSDEELAEA